jgi:CBS domain-containing protein
MSADPRHAVPELSLTEAARIMKDEDVGSLPVVDTDGRLIGIITDRDIVIRAVAEQVDPQSVHVGDVASRSPVTAAPEDDLDDALSAMAASQVRRLPVVEEGRLVGMLAQADVATEAQAGKVGATVEAISQRDG